MTQAVSICAALALAAGLAGCTSLSVTAPTGSVSMPQQITVTESVGFDGGTQGPRTIRVDGVDAEHFGNVNYSVPSGSTLCCLAPGPHAVSVSDKTSSRSVSASSSFTVSACPGCYSCQGSSTVHPVFGVCCDGGNCDVPASSNFGPWRFPAQASCPTPQIKANYCLNQNANAICGQNGVGCAATVPTVTQMVAVSFSPVQSGALKQIHVPIGHRTGSNQFRAWITSDNGGRPGTVLEAFSLPNIRTQAFPTQSSMHIFSAARPNLAGGTTYWLVIGPGGQDTVGSWNYSLDDAPAAGSSNFLVNTTPGTNNLPQLAGPWAPASSLLRPAFQIDIR